MVGDVGRIRRQDVAHDLVDGIVALLLQGFVDGGQDIVDLLILILSRVELSGVIVHIGTAFHLYAP